MRRQDDWEAEDGDESNQQRCIAGFGTEPRNESVGQCGEQGESGNGSFQEERQCSFSKIRQVL